MLISAEYPDPIESIDCEAAGVRVVDLDKVSGAQEMSTSGMMMYLTPSYHPRMPEGCPLTLKMVDRELGNFAVCVTCEYGLLDHDDDEAEQ